MILFTGHPGHAERKQPRGQ